MNFASTTYLLFLTIVVTLVLLFPKRYAMFIIFPSCLIFYGWWNWKFVSLLVLSAVVDYFCGLVVDKERHPSFKQFFRKMALLTSICVNIGILGIFKYFDFFSRSTQEFLGLFGFNANFLTLDVILPVGISFYTFQTMSYTIDVYRGTTRSTTHFMDFAVYVSFFPQLVAGPIERAGHLLPQIRRIRLKGLYRCDLGRGVFMICQGIFLKKVIANNMADFVDPMFLNFVNQSADQVPHSWVDVWVGMYFFSAQIYCDFYGYTLIALGSAYLFGIRLVTNFEHPYFATNIQNFWQRWHISLTRWFRDYVYIPLGGNRVSSARMLINLFIIQTSQIHS